MAENNNTIIGDFLLRNTNDAQQLGLSSNAQQLSAQFADAIFDPYNQDVYNHFLDYLIKVPGFMYTRTQSFENVLKPFIKRMPYGNTAIENQVGWVQAHTYDPDADSKLLSIYKGRGGQAYHQVNYQVKFPLTVNYDALRTAFDSDLGLNTFIAQQTQSIINSDEYAMYRRMLQVLAEYDKNTPMYTVHYDSAPNSVDSARLLLSDMLSWTRRIGFPNAAYNGSEKAPTGSIATFAKPDEMVLLVTPEIYGYYQVLGYGMLFNEDRAEVPYRVVVVDEFPVPGVFAVLCAEDWFQCYDQIYTINSFFDADTLNTQYRLIHTAATSASPFAPIVCFGTRAATEPPIVVQTVTGLDITPADGHITRGGELQLAAKLTGTIAPETAGVEVAPNAAVWSVTAEVPATTGASAKAAVPVALNTRTRVNRNGVLKLQASGIPTGTVLHVTGTSAYTNPSGDTQTFTKTVNVTVDD